MSPASKKRKAVLLDLVTYAVLAVFAAVALGPLLWGLSTSLKPESQVMTYPPVFLSQTPTLENYSSILFKSNYAMYFRNSVLITLVSVCCALVVAGHAAYAFSRLKFRGSDKLMFIVLMTTMIPAVAQLIPLYILGVHTGIYNTKFMLVLVYTAWRAPILTWLLKGFFDQSPVEIEEAARVDGCSRPGIFYRIVLPLSRPGLASVALISAIYVWNDYLVSSSFVTKEEHRMLSVGIYNFITAYGIQWGQMMAGVCLSVIPIIILFVCLQKQFVAGLSVGAVKG